MKVVQERMEAKIEDNGEKFEVLRGTLVFWMDIHQARAEANQERLEAKVEANLEDMANVKTQIGCLASHIDGNQEKVEVSHLELKLHSKEILY
jgi:hypothetical protein